MLLLIMIRIIKFANLSSNANREAYHVKQEIIFDHEHVYSYVVCTLLCLWRNEQYKQQASAKANAPAETASEAPAAQFRSYETAKGAVEIPVKPLRVVTDYYGGELLSVGANVVGVEPSAFDNPFLKEQLKGVEDVGAPINVEKVLELQPDLIVVMYDESGRLSIMP